MRDDDEQVIEKMGGSANELARACRERSAGRLEHFLISPDTDELQQTESLPCSHN